MNGNYNVFQEVNHWWGTGRVRHDLLEKVERDILSDVISDIRARQIILIEGPRRIGKTSLIYQLINHLLKEKVNPKTIIYLSLDDPFLDKSRLFEDLIKFIEEFLIKKPILDFKNKIYIFLDEIARLPDWEFFLKRYYDQKYPVKFIITNSSTSFLVKRVKESLVGRIRSFKMLPFSLSEYLKLKGENDLLPLCKEAGSIWKSLPETFDFQKIFKRLAGIEKESKLVEKKLSFALRSYLLEGGFPEFIQMESGKARQNYFWENLAERVIYFDIPEIFRVEDRELLQKLLVYSISNSGSLLNINEIGTSFKAPRQTISNYLNYLKAGLLIELFEKYAKTAASRLRAFKKVYGIDSGMFIDFQHLSQEKLEAQGLWGRIAEIVVLSQMKKYFDRGKLYHFREKEYEVDFVVDFPERILPVEVKYREEIRAIKGMDYFRIKFKAKNGIVITKDLLSFQAGILFVPLKFFLE